MLTDYGHSRHSFSKLCPKDTFIMTQRSWRPVLRHRCNRTWGSGSGQKIHRGIQVTPELSAEVSQMPSCHHVGPFVNNSLLFMASRDFQRLSFLPKGSTPLLAPGSSFSVLLRGGSRIPQLSECAWKMSCPSLNRGYGPSRLWANLLPL